MPLGTSIITTLPTKAARQEVRVELSARQSSKCKTGALGMESTPRRPGPLTGRDHPLEIVKRGKT
jgi:hypothetical protein